MTNPNILWRESFGYGSSVWSQTYVYCERASNNNYGAVQVGRVDELQQWGRGSGGDEGWGMVGNPVAVAGLRATTLGFSGAIDTNAVSSNKVGVAFAYNQGGQIGGCVLCEFWDDDGLGDSSFSKPLLHLYIETLNDGRICAKNGTNSGFFGPGTIIGISPFVMPVGLHGANGNFTHIEITRPVIHATNGSVQVYADGALVLDLSGVVTRNVLGGSGKIGYVQPVAQENAILTDLVVHDCANAGRIGDKRVTYRRAKVGSSFTTGTGTYTAGTPSSGANLSCVSEQAADGDTTYITFDDTSLPKKVSFPCEPMPANTITVDEVTEHVIARKTDASADTMRQGMISGATEVDNGTDVSTPSGYNIFTLVGPAPGRQVDPHTSADWTVADCDAVEIVFERTA